MIQVRQSLKYDLEVQELEDGLLVGELRLTLDCQCVRCLKPFNTRWPSRMGCPRALEGRRSARDERLRGLDAGGREDILLEFPQHPLCDPECGGLPKAAEANREPNRAPGKQEASSSAWAELNKLKL